MRCLKNLLPNSLPLSLWMIFGNLIVQNSSVNIWQIVLVSLSLMGSRNTKRVHMSTITRAYLLFFLLISNSAKSTATCSLGIFAWMACIGWYPFVAMLNCWHGAQCPTHSLLSSVILGYVYLFVGLYTPWQWCQGVQTHVFVAWFWSVLVCLQQLYIVFLHFALHVYMEH